jgi:hypothetical protein
MEPSDNYKHTYGGLYQYMGAAVAQLVARWAADLQVEQSILRLGCVSSKKFASLTQVAPGPNIASSVQTGPKAAFIIYQYEIHYEE